MEKEDGEICRLQINTTDYILFSVKEYRGRFYVDMRKYVISDSYTGFTKQGIRFNADLFPEFEEKVAELKNSLPKIE
jgi:Transcriptional Coactivator p15 (PC4)